MLADDVVCHMCWFIVGTHMLVIITQFYVRTIGPFSVDVDNARTVRYASLTILPTLGILQYACCTRLSSMPDTYVEVLSPEIRSGHAMIW